MILHLFVHLCHLLNCELLEGRDCACLSLFFWHLVWCLVHGKRLSDYWMHEWTLHIYFVRGIFVESVDVIVLSPVNFIAIFSAIDPPCGGRPIFMHSCVIAAAASSFKLPWPDGAVMRPHSALFPMVSSIEYSPLSSPFAFLSRLATQLILPRAVFVLHVFVFLITLFPSLLFSRAYPVIREIFSNPNQTPFYNIP